VYPPRSPCVSPIEESVVLPVSEMHRVREDNPLGGPWTQYETLVEGSPSGVGCPVPTPVSISWCPTGISRRCRAGRGRRDARAPGGPQIPRKPTGLGLSALAAYTAKSRQDIEGDLRWDAHRTHGTEPLGVGVCARDGARHAPAQNRARARPRHAGLPTTRALVTAAGLSSDDVYASTRRAVVGNLRGGVRARARF